MKGLKEFKEKIESDAAFRAKFADVADEKQLLALAKTKGYDLEQLSDDDLDMVGGGGIGDSILFGMKTIMFTIKHPVSTGANIIKAVSDKDPVRVARLAQKIDSQDIYELGDEAVNTFIDKGI